MNKEQAKALEQINRELKSSLAFVDRPPHDIEFTVHINKALLDFIQAQQDAFGGPEGVVRRILQMELQRTYSEWVRVNEEQLQEWRDAGSPDDATPDELDHLIGKMTW